MKKFVIILFGEMGSGKSHLGRKIADREGVPFVEGDRYLPEDMRQAVSKFGVVTADMRARLVDQLVKQVTIWTYAVDGIVLAQALYKAEDRERLHDRLRANGFVVEWAWVKPGFWRNLKQLWGRSKPLRWIGYWLASKPSFEPPDDALPGYVLNEEGTRWTTITG